MHPDVNVSTQPGVNYWKQLSTAADSGLMTIEPDVAGKLSGACDKYIGQLNGILGRVYDLDLRGSMGEFPSGRQLETKFNQLAVAGDRSLETVLLEHIAIVKAMQEFFQRFLTDVTGQDDENASLIGTTEPR